MELYKKQIHNTRCKKDVVSQIALEEDYIVPDSKGDIKKIVQQEGWIVIDDAKAMEGHVAITGSLRFKNLYVVEKTASQLECISGEIPFNEVINIEDAAANDVIKIKWDIEDFSIIMVNSRKVSTRALITFTVEIEELIDEGVCSEVRDNENAKVLTKNMDLLELSVNKKDIYRIKDEVSIPSNKPNIEKIIWESCQLRNVEIRPDENALQVKGELLIFVIYKPQEENANAVWQESNVNFVGSVECMGTTPDMVADIEYNPVSMNIEARADYDGELRVIGIDGALELSIKLYDNSNITYIEDVYQPGKEVVISNKEQSFEKLIVKNISRCRIAERLQMDSESERVLQICHCRADVKIDESMIVEDGINVEGVIDTSLLYVTADDESPFEDLNAAVPFSHFIEAQGIDDKSVIRLRPRIEQLSAIMAGADEVEIKGVIGIDAFVTRINTKNMIEAVEEKPIDYSKLQDMPGIAVYMVQNGDNLWKLAKKYYTTVERIKETNKLQSDEISMGDRLIIVKEV